MKIAIMQPYFIPYAGYFRLFCASDLFVVYDCVQFPRRGWVHRNQLTLTHNNTLSWLTLPLQKQPVDTAIHALQFRENSQTEWHQQLRQFAVYHVLEQHYPVLFARCNDISARPVDCIVGWLKAVCELLNIPFNIAFSSQLNLSHDLKGQDRILAIAKHFQATDYINAPGGRSLYDANVFSEHNIRLHFLNDYQGDFHSILQGLMHHTPYALHEHIYSQSTL